MAASALAMRIAQWLAGGRRGPPPAGATPADIAAVAPTATPASPPAEPSPVPAPEPDPRAATDGPVGSPTGPKGKKDTDLPNKGEPSTLSELQKAQNRRQVADWELELAREALARLRGSEEGKANPSVVAAAEQEVGRREQAANSAANEVQQQTQAGTRAPAGADAGYTDETVAGRRIRRYWKWDGYGNKVPDTSKGDKGIEDVGSALSGMDEQTAQLNYDRALAAYQAENDPVVKEQRRVALATAQQNLADAQRRAQQEGQRFPIDLATAQLNYDRAKAAFDQETSPEAKEQRRVALETAKVALDQAKQNLNKPTEVQNDGYLIRVRPDGSLERVDTLTPEQRARREEAAAGERETALRGTLPTNARAAYEQESTRLLGRAQQELERLKGLQEQGVVSAEQAERQFRGWFDQYVATPLTGLRAAAEEAQRAERARVEEANLQEERRVQAANQQREQLAAGYGEQERARLVATFPNARSPEFAQAYGANVAAMSQRVQGRTAEERMAAPRGPGYTGAAFSPQNIVNVMPDPDTIARAARDRALAAIAPVQAIRQGFSAPALPSMPDIAAIIANVPYRGPLSQLPSPASGLLPTPGREAVDLGPMGQPGFARTYYGPNGEVYGPDWRIPG